MTKNLYFENSSLDHYIKDILKSNDFTKMTDIQHKTIPLMLNNKDIIVQSQTGTGKTLSFVLPILHNYYKNPTFYSTSIVSLIITPTRELSLQINQIFNLFKINSKCFIGGMVDTSLDADTKIVVGTPGRLYEIIKNNTKLFRNINYLVLDEADRLISLGFKDKVLDIVSLLPKKKSCGFFSATVDDNLRSLSKSLLRNPVFVQGCGTEIPSNLSINYTLTESNMKLPLCIGLVKNKKSIIFFSTCNQVDFFYSFLLKYFVQVNKEVSNLNIFKIHRKMKQEDRNEVYKGFYEKGDILLCTDVAARGIDFKDIDLVIHFDIPNDFNNIIHRSGRTARNGSKGKSILLIMPNEKSYLDYLKLKGLQVEESSYPQNTEEINALKSYMDDSLYDLSVRAFVSYFRSYKEHTLTYLLDYTTLNYDNLVDLYMLKKIPGMSELRNINFKNFPREEKEESKKLIPIKRKKQSTKKNPASENKRDKKNSASEKKRNKKNLASENKRNTKIVALEKKRNKKNSASENKKNNKISASEKQ